MSQRQPTVGRSSRGCAREPKSAKDAEYVPRTRRTGPSGVGSVVQDTPKNWLTSRLAGRDLNLLIDWTISDLGRISSVGDP